MRRKITIFGFFSEDSGLTCFIKTNYHALVAEGYDFNIINTANYRPARELKRLGTYYEVPFYFSDINGRNFFQKRKNFIRELKDILEECRNTSQTIHLYLNTLCDPISIILAHKANFNRIITHAYADYTNIFNIAEKQLQYVGRKMVEKYATDYIAVTPEAANFFYSKKLQRSPKFSIIQNGIAVKKQRYHEEQNLYYRKRYGIDSKTFVIGNVGRFINSKNQVFLVECFDLFQKIYPNAKLVFIGDGPMIEDVRQRVYQLNLESKVIFTGYLENTEEVQNIFNVFAYPAISDGLSLSLLHSIANGAMAVVSNTQSQQLKELDGIVSLPIDNAQLWADEFYRLNQRRYNRSIQSEKIMSELIQHGFTISTVSRQLKKLYGRPQWED
ncbi:glycosyltransferase [Ligilactobacillus cholophilus]|uniref:glycosyltransferase n=1 Tax=Ligilactobacillus cholophilus TaxID=3050131 RepID=UPI0025AED84B|nr:glycosyltransferase [Ligilactobacillus cholophilus]